MPEGDCCILTEVASGLIQNEEKAINLDKEILSMLKDKDVRLRPVIRFFIDSYIDYLKQFRHSYLDLDTTQYIKKIIY